MEGAAFFRVEGTLVSRPALAAAAWLAANAQEIGQRLARLGNVAAAAPLSFAGGLLGGTTATRMAWAAVRGLSEDRLHVLGREYYDQFLEPKLSDTGLDLIARCKKRGQRVVLISDHVDLLVGPLRERVGAAELVSNRLEIAKGHATGRLLDPVVGGHLSGQWARAFAAERAIDSARLVGLRGARRRLAPAQCHRPAVRRQPGPPAPPDRARSGLARRRRMSLHA